MDNGLTLLPPLEQLVPKDHHLRKIDRVLDLSFVHEALSEKYCPNNGRPSIDPEVVMRLFTLQALENIPSVRKLMREVQVNLAYRWFIGYRLDEELPDHSTLSRALDRMGDDVFDQLFNRSVAQCQKSGLLGGKVLHLDATTIRADLDIKKVNKSNSSDKDARFGRFPGGSKKPGYKQDAIADGKKRVIVGVTVKPANAPDDSDMSLLLDDVIDRLGFVPEALCADGAYGSGKNCALLEERGMRLVSPPQKTLSREGRFTVEEFVFDESNDVFVCPAGKRLQYIGDEVAARKRRRYAALRSVCGVCDWKSCCTKYSRREIKVSAHHGSLVRLRADSKTESFKKLYRQRSPVIEGVFAEAKQWHGLGRAWRRGLMKMRIQSLLIASVMNYKRLGALCRLLLQLKQRRGRVFRAFRSNLKKAMKFLQSHMSAGILTIAFAQNDG